MGLGGIFKSDKWLSFKEFLMFLGPGVLVSVGYVDPGNWATDIEGGSKYGYKLLWVLFFSNSFALVLQTLCARLGLVTGQDLAVACKTFYPKPVAVILWLLTELAIAATDLAEVLGTAIGLNLLFKIPLIIGVILTALDTLVFLVVQRFGHRIMEFIILSLMAIISVCFMVEVFFTKPKAVDVMKGIVIPLLPKGSLYLATGILGATIMPHNLYLHSGIIQSRRSENLKRDCQFALWDGVISLNLAFLVNASILIVATRIPWEEGGIEIQDAYHILGNIFPKVAPILFGIALICAGQSSTLTGTMAGQIVMEGFVDLKIAGWLRRLITRSIAIIPAAIVIIISGNNASSALLVWSQVILSIQLPFAMVPLIRFTSSKDIMGSFKTPFWVNPISWVCVLIISGLNVWLVVDSVQEYLQGHIFFWFLAAIPTIFWCALLIFITFCPLRLEEASNQDATQPEYAEYRSGSSFVSDSSTDSDLAKPNQEKSPLLGSNASSINNTPINSPPNANDDESVV